MNDGQLKSKLDALWQLIAELDNFLEQEDWTSLEEVLAKRNELMTEALIPSLPESLHESARQLLAKLREQDENLLRVAKQMQAAAGEELIQINRGKKNIQSYRE